MSQSLESSAVPVARNPRWRPPRRHRSRRGSRIARPRAAVDRSRRHVTALGRPMPNRRTALPVVFVVLVELRVLSYAHQKIVIRPCNVFGIMVLTLLGSHVEHPALDVRATVPRPGGVVAINVGGALQRPAPVWFPLDESLAPLDQLALVGPDREAVRWRNEHQQRDQHGNRHQAQCHDALFSSAARRPEPTNLGVRREDRLHDWAIVAEGRCLGQCRRDRPNPGARCGQRRY
jgi:hypothetical protein